MKKLVSIVILSVPLLLLKAWVEDTTWERSLELWAYRQFSVLLDVFQSRPRTRVIIVDLSKLPARSTRPNTQPVTPRADLEKLITALDKAGAAAIGLDIDFSPEDGLYVDQDDPKFLESWLRCSSPVFVGVARRAGAAEEAWLGDRRFSKMAAAMLVPNEHDQLTEQGIPSPYPTRIPIIRRADAHGQENQGLRSMGLALASVVQPDIERLLSETGPLFRSRGRQQFVQSQEIWEFTVDESYLGHLRDDRREPRASNGGIMVCRAEGSDCASGTQDVSGAIVLIGDAERLPESSREDRDVFLHDGAPWRGVYYHASAALTLLNGPLRVFTAPGRVVMDLLAAFIPSLLFMVWQRDGDSVTWKIMGFIGTLGVVAAAAVLLLRYRVLWLDWVPVLLAVGLHMLYEEPMLPLLGWISSTRKQ